MSAAVSERYHGPIGRSRRAVAHGVPWLLSFEDSDAVTIDVVIGMDGGSIGGIRGVARKSSTKDPINADAWPQFRNASSSRF
jgi:hypothetical protein